MKLKLDRFLLVFINDGKKFYDLVDLLIEIVVIKEDFIYVIFLLYFDLFSGILFVVKKLLMNF